MTKVKGFSTKQIHGNLHKGGNASNALNSPIFMTSTFTFNSLEHVEEVMTFKSDDYVYTRGNNPTLRELEEKMAILESGVSSVAFSSGMAAISSVLLSLLKSGDKVILSNTLYGSTYTVQSQLLPRYGIECELIDLSGDNVEESLKSSIDSKTKCIYFETPSNPDLSIIDIKKISSIAKSIDSNIKIVVDNTFATPYLQRPLELGADIVVHSATKYLGGHGDVVGGIAVAKDADYINSLKFEYMCELGGVMSPFNGWLILRGLKTLSLRMERHCENAMQIARFLETHPMIESVNYPGLPGFKGYEIAKTQMMGGFGGMISFELKGGLEAAGKFVEGLSLFKLAVSLGDAESLIEVPSLMTHRGYDLDESKSYGFTQSMVRISVGLEDEKDLIEDLITGFDSL